MELTGRVVVVTGAARGIGRALATRFVKEGPRALVVVDIDEAGVRRVARDIGASAFRCDVANDSDVERLLGEVETHHGPIDIFCSNAGIAVGGGPETPDED